MAKLLWDQEGQKRYETGCDHGVLYVRQSTASDIPGISGASTNYSKGVVWNGLTSVSKSPSGAEANDIWADNIKYASIRSAETFGATVEAYMYPDEFAECDGSAIVTKTTGSGAQAVTVNKGVSVGQQRRKPFGFSFRTDIGYDTDSGIDADSAYKIHLIYGATASPSEQSFSTINDSPEAITFSWELTTIPVTVGEVDGVKYLPTACLTIDSSKADPNALAAFEEILYGRDADTSVSPQVEAYEPMLPMPKDVIEFFKNFTT